MPPVIGEEFLPLEEYERCGAQSRELERLLKEGETLREKQLRLMRKRWRLQKGINRIGLKIVEGQRRARAITGRAAAGMVLRTLAAIALGLVLGCVSREQEPADGLSSHESKQMADAVVTIRKQRGAEGRQ